MSEQVKSMVILMTEAEFRRRHSADAFLLLRLWLVLELTVVVDTSATGP